MTPVRLSRDQMNIVKHDLWIAAGKYKELNGVVPGLAGVPKGIVWFQRWQIRRWYKKHIR